MLHKILLSEPTLLFKRLFLYRKVMILWKCWEETVSQINPQKLQCSFFYQLCSFSFIVVLRPVTHNSFIYFCSQNEEKSEWALKKKWENRKESWRRIPVAKHRLQWITMATKLKRGSGTLFQFQFAFMFWRFIWCLIEWRFFIIIIFCYNLCCFAQQLYFIVHRHTCFSQQLCHHNNLFDIS